MRLSHIGYFLVLCKELNFTRAARRCRISQPSLSNAIQSLERELGGPLFNRGKPLSLTALGKNVRPYLQRAFTNVEKARFWHSMRDTPHPASSAKTLGPLQETSCE